MYRVNGEDDTVVAENEDGVIEDTHRGLEGYFLPIPVFDAVSVGELLRIRGVYGYFVTMVVANGALDSVLGAIFHLHGA